MAVALVVEDEWLVRMEIAEALGAQGWDVIEVSTGDAALLHLGKEPPIDLVVTDIRLPGKTSGWDIAEAFRATDSRVGIIYCSGNTADTTRQVPGSLFLTKPCRINLLIAASVRLRPDAAGLSSGERGS